MTSTTFNNYLQQALTNNGPTAYVVLLTRSDNPDALVIQGVHLSRKSAADRVNHLKSYDWVVEAWLEERFLHD